MTRINFIYFFVKRNEQTNVPLRNKRSPRTFKMVATNGQTYTVTYTASKPESKILDASSAEK